RQVVFRVAERVLPPSFGLNKPHNYVIYIYICFFFCPSVSLSLFSLSLSLVRRAWLHTPVRLRSPTIFPLPFPRVFPSNPRGRSIAALPAPRRFLLALAFASLLG
ncbi:unnamed protein product, partial [Musa acuminata var. zebrina]